MRMSGACSGSRTAATAIGSGRRGSTRKVCRWAGTKAASSAAAAHPPARRVAGTAISAAVTISATPLACTHARASPSSGGTSHAYVCGRTRCSTPDPPSAAASTVAVRVSSTRSP